MGAVQRRDDCITRRRRFALLQEWKDRRESGIDAFANQVHTATNAAVDETGNATRRTGRDAAERSRQHLYRAMHLLYDVGNAG